MAQAARDQNFVPTLLGVSSSDGVTPVAVYADPVTHRLLVDDGAGTGISAETPVGAVNSSNTVFTVTEEPLWVVSDGITYFDGAGYTYAALSITMDSPPSQFIRAIITS